MASGRWKPTCSCTGGLISTSSSDTSSTGCSCPAAREREGGRLDGGGLGDDARSKRTHPHLAQRGEAQQARGRPHAGEELGEAELDPPRSRDGRDEEAHDLPRATGIPGGKDPAPV